MPFKNIIQCGGRYRAVQLVSFEPESMLIYDTEKLTGSGAIPVCYSNHGKLELIQH